MFTSDEIDMLIDAVDAWEKIEIEKTLNETMIMAMFSTKEETHDMFSKVKDDLGNEAAKVRKEQAILMKAKLIHMREKAVVSEISAGL